MERFADEEALDLLIAVRRDPTHGVSLTEQQVERICRRILGHLSDEEFENALSERQRIPRWSSPYSQSIAD